MSEKFIKPHCRVLSANISELLISTEAFIDSWRGFDRSKKQAEAHLAKIEENYNALPDEFKSRLSPYMAIFKETLPSFYEITKTVTNAREFQKTALSEGLVQIAACISEEQ